MGRRNYEVNRTGHKSGVPGSHQLFRRFALARAVDDGLATICKVRTGTTRAGLIVFSHGYSLTRLVCECEFADGAFGAGSPSSLFARCKAKRVKAGAVDGGP